MRRTDWKFEVSTQALLDASEKKADHHRDRKEHWEGVRDEKKKEYRKSLEKSIDKATDREAIIEQAMVTSNKVRSTMPNQQQIQGDQEVFEELREAQQKVEFHHDQIVGYELWVRLFDQSSVDSRKVNFDDAVYFGL